MFVVASGEGVGFVRFIGGLTLGLALGLVMLPVLLILVIAWPSHWVSELSHEPRPSGAAASAAGAVRVVHASWGETLTQQCRGRCDELTGSLVADSARLFNAAGNRVRVRAEAER